MRIVSLLVFLVIIPLYWAYGANTFSFNNQLVDAADAGNTEKVLELLRRGHNPDSKGDFNVTPLMRAAFRGYTKIAEILIESGAYVNASDIGGDTPLHLAARNGNSEIVKMLLYYDAYIDIPDKEKWTPLMRAIMAKKTDVASILIEKGADLNASNSMDESVLVHASMIGRPEIMELILGSKGFKDIPTEQKQIAINTSERRGYDNIGKMISATVDHIQNKFAATSPFSNNESDDEEEVEIILPQSDTNEPATTEKEFTSSLSNIGDNGSWGFLDESPFDDTNNIKPQIPQPTYKPTRTYSEDNSQDNDESSKYSYSLQLGSFSSKEQALFIWDSVRNQNQGILSGLESNISHVRKRTEGANSTDLYRLRVGKYKQKNHAETSCFDLKSRNVECFVVKSSNEPEILADNSNYLNAAPRPTYIPQPSNDPNAPIDTAPRRKPLTTPDHNNKMRAEEKSQAYSYSDQNISEQQPVSQPPIEQELPWLNTQNQNPQQQIAPHTPPASDFSYNPNANQKDFSYDQNTQKQDYSEFYKEVERKNIRKDRISEAVLVKNTRPTPSTFQTASNGLWLEISAFPNQATANDYGDRMFRYDENLSHLQVNLIDAESPYGRQVNMQVGPMNNSNQANSLCNSVRSGGLNCSVSGVKSTPITRESRTQLIPKTTPRPNYVTYWINLGTFSDSPEAEYYWTFLHEDNEDILGGLKYQIAKADEHGELSAEAVKLKLGPFNNKSRAEQICNIMNYRNVACLVIN